MEPHPSTVRPAVNSSAQSAVSRCPVEVWLHAFKIACTDGGKTGCALSLVSKRMRDMSAPVQLRSAAIDGVPNMKVFFKELQRRPPSHRRVRCLLLADSQRRDDSTSYNEVDRAECRSAYKAIVMMIASTLETLTIMLYGITFSLDAFVQSGVTFPMLVDLTVNGSLKYHSHGRGDTATEIPPLPALRRIHLHDTNLGCTLLERLAGAAPGLTYLRMSGHSSERRLATRLSVMLRMGGKDSDQRVHTFPRTLRYVTLQFYQYPRGGKCGTGRMVHGRMMRELELLEGNVGNLEGAMVFVLPEQPRLPRYVDEQAKAGWLEVIVGGDGCWYIPKDRAVPGGPVPTQNP